MIAISLSVLQHTVYEHKTFVKGLRSCPSQPKCVIGGACSEGCVCSQGNRHTASDAKLLKRMSTHAEQSTRQKFHTGKFCPVSGDAPAAVGSADSGVGGAGEHAAAGEMSDQETSDLEPWAERLLEVTVRDELRHDISGLFDAVPDEDGARDPDLDPAMDF